MKNINKLRNNSLFQFILYSSIGGINLLIDIAVMNILMSSFKVYSGSILFFFKIISLFVYSINGYIMNKKLTFQSNASKKSYFPYITVLGISAIANGYILVLLTSHKTNFNPSIWANISNLVASITTGTVSFLVNKFFVFNKNKPNH